MMIIFELTILIYFAFVSTYAFFFTVAGLSFRKPNPKPANVFNTFAVLIPAYKEDNVIISVAQDALRQHYPEDKFRVIIIADSLQPATIARLKQLPISLVEVFFEKSTKVKALNSAMASVGNNFNYALILDADNVMEPDFLRKMNDLIEFGYRAIQAERVSKNATTSMSVLDGLSERINNFVYRQGHVGAGLSCSLIGSGMVFQYEVVKDILSKLDSIGGFDRELELELIRKGFQIKYAKGTLVYDEKVENTDVFENQRKRWLSSQFTYLRKYFWEGIGALFLGKIALFNSAILKNIQLPRLINLGLLFLVTCLAFLIHDKLRFGFYPWLIFFLMNIAAIVFAIPLRMYNWQLLKSVLLLPKVFVKMFNLLFRLRGANKTFIHTPHGTTKVSADEKTN